MNNKNFIIALTILLIAIACVHGLRMMRGEVVIVEKNFNKIPYRIGDWTGVDHDFGKEVYDVLRADDNFSRIYTRQDGKSLGLYIGYYGTKRGGHPEHTPAGCYTGAGWGVVSQTPLRIVSSDGTQTITVNNFLAQKREEQEQGLYWLQNFRGEVSHTGLQQNIKKIKSLILYNRNDGAFIRINSRVKGTREETVQFQKEFARELLPLLPKYWPVEEVQK